MQTILCEGGDRRKHPARLHRRLPCPRENGRIFGMTPYGGWHRPREMKSCQEPIAYRLFFEFRFILEKERKADYGCLYPLEKE